MLYLFCCAFLAPFAGYMVICIWMHEWSWCEHHGRICTVHMNMNTYQQKGNDMKVRAKKQKAKETQRVNSRKSYHNQREKFTSVEIYPKCPLNDLCSKETTRVSTHVSLTSFTQSPWAKSRALAQLKEARRTLIGGTQGQHLSGKPLPTRCRLQGPLHLALRRQSHWQRLIVLLHLKSWSRNWQG